jgi:hypothetical protein
MTVHCPDLECYELAMKLHQKLNCVAESNENDNHLIYLLNCLIQNEQARLWNQKPHLYLVK